MYLRETGIKDNLQIAALLFEKAAQSGPRRCAISIGGYVLHRAGVMQDLVKGVAWYEGSSDVDGKLPSDVIVDISGVKRHAVTDDHGRFRLDKLSTDARHDRAPQSALSLPRSRST